LDWAAIGRAGIFVLAFNPTSTTTDGHLGTIPAFLGQPCGCRALISLAEAQKQVAVPYVFPWIHQDISSGDIIRLARQYIAVWFDAQGVFCRIASFHTYFEI
jgi:hypothetical protein